MTRYACNHFIFLLLYFDFISINLFSFLFWWLMGLSYTMQRKSIVVCNFIFLSCPCPTAANVKNNRHHQTIAIYIHVLCVCILFSYMELKKKKKKVTANCLLYAYRVYVMSPRYTSIHYRQIVSLRNLKSKF